MNSAQVSLPDTLGYIQDVTNGLNSGIDLVSTNPEVGLGIAVVVGLLLVRAGWAIAKPILKTVFWPLRLIL
jgi:hypothetical protein